MKPSAALRRAGEREYGNSNLGMSLGISPIPLLAADIPDIGMGKETGPEAADPTSSPALRTLNFAATVDIYSIYWRS